MPLTASSPTKSSRTPWSAPESTSRPIRSSSSTRSSPGRSDRRRLKGSRIGSGSESPGRPLVAIIMLTARELENDGSPDPLVDSDHSLLPSSPLWGPVAGGPHVRDSRDADAGPAARGGPSRSTPFPTREHQRRYPLATRSGGAAPTSCEGHRAG